MTCLFIIFQTYFIFYQFYEVYKYIYTLSVHIGQNEFFYVNCFMQIFYR